MRRRELRSSWVPPRNRSRRSRSPSRQDHERHEGDGREHDAGLQSELRDERRLRAAVIATELREDHGLGGRILPTPPTAVPASGPLLRRGPCPRTLRLRPRRLVHRATTAGSTLRASRHLSSPCPSPSLILVFAVPRARSCSRLLSRSPHHRRRTPRAFRRRKPLRSSVNKRSADSSRGELFTPRRRYQPALTELNASLDIVASPNTRLYIARTLREMGKSVPAYVELGRAAVEANELVRDDARYEQAATAARDERAQLEPKLGVPRGHVAHAGPDTNPAGLRRRSPSWRLGRAGPGLTRRGCGRRRDPWSTARHASESSSSAAEHKQVAIDAGAESTPAPVEPAPVETNTTPSALRPVAWATAGVAVAGLAMFVVAGAMANGTYSNLEKTCGSGRCPPGHAGDVSAGRTQADARQCRPRRVRGAGGASVTLFVISMPNKKSTKGKRRSDDARHVGPSSVISEGRSSRVYYRDGGGWDMNHLRSVASFIGVVLLAYTCDSSRAPMTSRSSRIRTLIRRPARRPTRGRARGRTQGRTAAPTMVPVRSRELRDEPDELCNARCDQTQATCNSKCDGRSRCQRNASEERDSCTSKCKATCRTCAPTCMQACG